MNERSRSIFSMVGDGAPAKIEKAAYSISKEDLRTFAGGHTVSPSSRIPKLQTQSPMKRGSIGKYASL
jgi:hypothetical protein